jgi:tRNA nucleotidyltransferase (CCA-adding enzyme)
MRRITAAGELDALVAERVWQETDKALRSSHPHIYFAVLRDAEALKVIFPEIDALFGVPQPAQWHPEIDTGIHTLMVLEQAARLSAQPSVRFAALTHDLGKGATPKEQWPKHHGHEAASVQLLEKLCDRLRVPNEYRECAAGVARYHGHAHRAQELRPATVLACEADMRGRTGFEERAYPQADYLRRAQGIAAAVKLDAATLATLPGPKIGERIREARIAALKTALQAGQNGG